MVSYYSSVTPVIRNHPIFMQYSNHKELKTDNSPNQVVSTKDVPYVLNPEQFINANYSSKNDNVYFCPAHSTSHREHKRHCRLWMLFRQEVCLWPVLMEWAWGVRALCWESLLRTSSTRLLLMSFIRYLLTPKQKWFVTSARVNTNYGFPFVLDLLQVWNSFEDYNIYQKQPVPSACPVRWCSDCSAFKAGEWHNGSI